MIHRYKYQGAVWFEPFLTELLTQQAGPELVADRWDLIGGLLGDFEHRVKKSTGLDWISPLTDGEDGRAE